VVLDGTGPRGPFDVKTANLVVDSGSLLGSKAQLSTGHGFFGSVFPPPSDSVPKVAAPASAAASPVAARTPSRPSLALRWQQRQRQQQELEPSSEPSSIHLQHVGGPDPGPLVRRTSLSLSPSRGQKPPHRPNPGLAHAAHAVHAVHAKFHAPSRGRQRRPGPGGGKAWLAAAGESDLDRSLTVSDSSTGSDTDVLGPGASSEESLEGAWAAAPDSFETDGIDGIADGNADGMADGNADGNADGMAGMDGREARVGLGGLRRKLEEVLPRSAPTPSSVTRQRPPCPPPADPPIPNA
jgi:hypothetical protein